MPITISAISPLEGPLGGGTNIRLSGDFVDDTGTLYIDGTVPLNVYFSSTLVSATTRDNTVGSKTLTVVSDSGLSATSAFSYSNDVLENTWDDYSFLPNDSYFVYNDNSDYDADRMLYDRMLAEAYNKHGVSMTYYIIDYDTDKDKLFGEDTDRQVLRKFNVMAYTSDLPQEEELWTKFGIEGLDNFRIYIAKKHMEAASQQSGYGEYKPKQGDVIYIKYNNRYYNIIDVGEEEEMFLQRKHTWILTLNTFEDTHISLSAETSATMTDFSAVTNQETDPYDISDFIDTQVSAIEFPSSADSESPASIWGDW